MGLGYSIGLEMRNCRTEICWFWCCSLRRKDAALLDRVEEEDDSFSSAALVMSGYLWASGAEMIELNRDDLLGHAVDALYEKRGPAREKALAEIIEGFNSRVQIEFVKKQFVTLLHQCLSCIKRGSIREIALASHVIGLVLHPCLIASITSNGSLVISFLLLALTVGCGENANGIFEVSLPPITQALKSGMEASKLAVLVECLAIVTFVSGNDPEEKEKSMQLMWHLIRPKLGPNVVFVKPSPALITTVVTAWAFVLTSVDGNSRDQKQWMETVSYLSMLLDKDNRSLRIATGEALAIIFEKRSLDKFSSEAKCSNNVVCNSSHIQGLKGKIINQIRNLSMEAGGKGTAKKDLSNQRNLFRNIIAYVEDGCSLQTSSKIGRDRLSTSSWSQLIQLNYLKHFLGRGFVNHIQDNKFIQYVVGFVPKRFQHSDTESRMSSSEKRLYKSPNSVFSKARTQHLNKQRLMSQSKNSGRFTVAMEEDR